MLNYVLIGYTQTKTIVSHVYNANIISQEEKENLLVVGEKIFNKINDDLQKYKGNFLEEDARGYFYYIDNLFILLPLAKSEEKIWSAFIEDIKLLHINIDEISKDENAKSKLDEDVGQLLIKHSRKDNLESHKLNTENIVVQSKPIKTDIHLYSEADGSTVIMNDDTQARKTVKKNNTRVIIIVAFIIVGIVVAIVLPNIIK